MLLTINMTVEKLHFLIHRNEIICLEGLTQGEYQISIWLSLTYLRLWTFFNITSSIVFILFPLLNKSLLLSLEESSLNWKEMPLFRTTNGLDSREVFLIVDDSALGIKENQVIILCIVSFRKCNRVKAMLLFF